MKFRTILGGLLVLASVVAADDRTRTAPRPSSRPGRAVASVGPEVITLPEMIAEVKTRLGEVPAEEKLDQRQTIELAKAVYKVVIVRELVFQEAREVLGGPEPLNQLVRSLESRWDKRELPSLIRREGTGSEAGLRSKLAKRATTPNLLRDEFVVRAVATQLKQREPSPVDLAGYLENVRRRRPIKQIMTEAELMDAGRDAALQARRPR